VIEHIKNDKLALKNIYKILKPGGTLFLTVPALQKLYGKKDEEVGHYRRYDKKQLTSLLKGAGFQIKMIRYWNLIGVPAVWVSNKIFKTKVSESFRYKENLKNKIIQRILSFWFENIENNFNFRIGLTLFVIAKKPR
jgi:predicted SAM-dependent methyltransferase